MTLEITNKIRGSRSIERVRINGRKQWDPWRVAATSRAGVQKKGRVAAVAVEEMRNQVAETWREREREGPLLSFDRSRLALSPIKTISRALISRQSTREGSRAHERGELKEECVSSLLQNRHVSRSPSTPPPPPPPPPPP